MEKAADRFDFCEFVVKGYGFLCRQHVRGDLPLLQKIQRLARDMKAGFWKDRERYIDTYWSRFPDIWVHGDWAAVDNDRLWSILGRSDDTIKIAGKRVGPAEVESILVAHPQVSEAAAIGVPDSIKGEALVCFCVLKKDVDGDMALAAELRKNVGRDLGKALAPRDVLFVADLPKTRNAKVMRRVARAAFLGEKLGDISALENTASLEEIKRAAATQGVSPIRQQA